MFRKLYNQAIFSGSLRPDGPLLVVQGGASLDPLAPDLAFVRTLRGGEPTVYLPGSSLKGVLRAQGERLLATAIGDSAAEEPFNSKAPRRSAAQHEREKKDGETSAVYALSCEADRLFGSTQIAGRLRIGDACPATPEAATAANRTEVRYGVAISRAKQSVQVGPFEQEAVTGGSFSFQATLENFELWMLSLVIQVFRDLHEGLVQVGHSKSRGFGTVLVDEPTLRLRWPGAAPPRLEGVGARESSAAVRTAYALDAADWVELPAGSTAERDGLFAAYRYLGWEEIDRVQDRLAAGPWPAFVTRARRGAGHGT